MKCTMSPFSFHFLVLVVLWGGPCVFPFPQDTPAIPLGSFSLSPNYGRAKAHDLVM